MLLTAFKTIIVLVRDAITIFGITVILFGALEAATLFVSYLMRPKYITINKIRLLFGHKIILGLELLVGADIIKSVIQPGYYDLGILATLVIIRSILGYFLSKELSQINTTQ